MVSVTARLPPAQPSEPPVRCGAAATARPTVQSLDARSNLDGTPDTVLAVIRAHHSTTAARPSLIPVSAPLGPCESEAEIP